MTTNEEIRRRLRRQPFEPFCICLSDGKRFEVRHPELLLLGNSALILGVAVDPEKKEYDRAIDIDLFHIVRLEPLVPPQTAPGSTAAA